MRLKTLRSSKGFTLIEIIFVLAIVAVLAGILVPLAISSLGDSSKQKTRSDQDAIAAALTSFRKDVNRWPDNNSTTATLNFAVEYLLVADNATTGISSTILTSECPTEAAASFFATTACTASTASHNAFNHLGINNPNGNVTEGDASTGDYDPKKWKGPYAAKFGPDGFGQAHVIYMKGIDKSNTSVATVGTRGWIISAGFDGILQTKATDTTLSADDIGFIYCTSCQ